MNISARILALEHILPIWDNPDHIEETVRKTGHYDSSIIGEALEILHNEYDKDFLSLISKEAEGGKYFWYFYDPFIKALPNLKTTAPHLKRTLELVHKAERGDLAGGRVYDSIKSFSQLQPTVAIELLNLLTADLTSLALDFIAPIISGMANNDFSSAHTKALNLSRSRKTEFVCKGIIALSTIDYNPPEHDKELEATLHRMNQLMKTQSEAKAGALATAYGNLVQSGVDVGDYIAKLAERSLTEVQASVSVVLFRCRDELFDKQWFRDSLMCLESVTPEYKGILREIDMTLSGLVKHDYQLVFDFLERWFTCHKHPTGKDDSGIVDLYQSTYHTLFKHPDLVEKQITLWFNSNNHRLHRAAAAIVTDYSRDRPDDKRELLRLDKAVLDQCTDDDLVFILKKVLGYVILHGDVLSSLVFSLLRRSPCRKSIQNEVYHAFIEYIAYNFSGSSLDYLRNKANTGTKTEKIIASRIIQYMEQYYARLEKIPRLKKMEPPESRLIQFMKMRQKESQRITKQAEDKSVLLSIVTRVPLKAGKSFFHKFQGKYSEKTNLGQISTSIEIPRGEFLDPVGHAILLFNWRTLTRKYQA